MKQTIVFDFDGVIHKGYDGWRNGSIYGEIDNDLVDYMWELSFKYNIVISSCRPSKQIVDFMNEYCIHTGCPLRFAVTEDMFWHEDKIVGVTNRKPAGAIYIDDRGYKYTGMYDFVKMMEEFED